jgi:hypothetical protein
MRLSLARLLFCDLSFYRLSLRRLLLPGFVRLSCWLSVAAAQAVAQTPAAPAPALLPDMVFYVAKGGPNACGHGCDQWIVADGTFDAAAGQNLRQLLQKLAGMKLPVFFNSPGGYTLAALEVGRLLRTENLVAGVGRTTPAGCDRDKLYDNACQTLKRDGVTADLDETAAMCHSACVYALAGAAVRQVPPGARLGIHAAEIRPSIPVPAVIIAAAKEKADQRIDDYLHEMGIDPALFAAANAVPHQSLRFLQRDELVRFGLDTRAFGETGWHYVEKPRPAILKIYFVRSGGLQPAGSGELLYRNTFLRMNCGDARSMSLTIGVQTTANETSSRARRFAIAVNGVRIEYGRTAQTLISSGPNKYNLRTASVAVDLMTKVDDGGSIDILAPIPKGGAPSALTLTMDGFSNAYRKLRKACDAAARRRMPV